MQETKVKITNSDRIARILHKICEANLQVFIRAQDNLGLAVKAKASNVFSAKTTNQSAALTLRLSHISEQGMEYLEQKTRLRVEFIMMATKVMFVCHVVKSQHNTVLVSFPKSLVSIERRKNARFQTNDDALGFLKIGSWNPGIYEMAALPIYPQYRGLEGHLSLTDVSLGGVCAQSRFPAACQELKRGRVDDMSSLIFPMQPQIPVRFEIKWVKRIREHVTTDDGSSLAITCYKFGCEFLAQSEEVSVGIKQFINQVTQSEAI